FFCGHSANPQLFRNPTNIPQLNCGTLDICGFAEYLRDCEFADLQILDLKICNVSQYRKSQLFRNYIFAAPSLSVDTYIDNIKTKNWISTFYDQIGKPIIGRVLDKPNEDIISIEHWIQDVENDQMSPSVQLPIIKKCGGCEVKTSQNRSKRNNIKVRCITDVNIENCVKIDANSIQNDRYMIDMAIYEALAQAECKYYGKTSMNECIIEKVNGLFKYIHPSDYRN
ncbi:hypothetical protein RhiirA4_476395, partial [Rhizophagus irregularis]